LDKKKAEKKMMPQQQQVCRPVASNDTRSGPLAALINAMSSGANQGHFSQCGKDASFNQTLRDALNLQSNSLFANMQRGLAGVPKVMHVLSQIGTAHSAKSCVEKDLRRVLLQGKVFAVKSFRTSCSIWRWGEGKVVRPRVHPLCLEFHHLCPLVDWLGLCKLAVFAGPDGKK
jgi:hypothetical protein